MCGTDSWNWKQSRLWLESTVPGLNGNDEANFINTSQECVFRNAVSMMLNMLKALMGESVLNSCLGNIPGQMFPHLQDQVPLTYNVPKIPFVNSDKSDKYGLKMNLQLQ